MSSPAPGLLIDDTVPGTGAEAVAAYHRVLLGLIDASDREAVLKSIDEE